MENVTNRSMIGLTVSVLKNAFVTIGKIKKTRNRKHNNKNIEKLKEIIEWTENTNDFVWQCWDVFCEYDSIRTRRAIRERAEEKLRTF